MRRLDFISKPPNFSIFKEGANKTNLGGFLFLVYIAIILVLALVNFFDYFVNDKYQFNYSVVKGNKDANKNTFLKNMEKIELTYRIWLTVDQKDLIYNENFTIVDLNKSPNDSKFIINQIEEFNYSVNELNFGVLYKCNGNNCTIRDEDKIRDNSYYLHFLYSGFSIDHQNPEKPIQPFDGYYYKEIQFLNNTNIIVLNWEVIEYEEEKGVFGKTFDKVMGNNNKYYGGDYKSTETITDDGHFKTFPQTHWNYKDPEGNDYILLLFLQSIPTRVVKEYEKYTRKKVSVLGIIANIASLSSTVLNLMSLFYGILYAGNYNNYKIIENILTKKMKININKNTKNEGDIEDAGIELISDLKENDLIINEQDSSDTVEEENEKKERSSLNLSIPRFIDFLFHEFYSKCCGHSSKHILINSCNDIVAKYTTIENILYNQMKLECLWKDYKWNNPQFQKGDKEDLILDLKEK